MAKLPEPKTKLEPGFKPKMKPPTSVPALAHWPPEGHRGWHRVKLGENWLSVAMFKLIPDVWDLIYFNFRTMDPKEVNTYLRHYVGCWKSAPDGKNFRFTDEDDPGHVYIPPYGWKRGDYDLPFHAEVRSLLEKSVARFPYLVLGNYHVTPTDLTHVIMAMREGRIGVVHDHAISTPAEWRWKVNVMAIRDLGISSWTGRNHLIHEATHAIVDYKKFEIWGWQNEFLAYTTMALWGRAQNAGLAEALVAGTSHPNPWHDAYVLARYLRGGGGTMKHVKAMDTRLPDYRDTTKTINPVANLKLAIMSSKSSSLYWWKYFGFDGV